LQRFNALIMKKEKLTVELDMVDDRIHQCIRKKKDENSALKKLLSALENAKKNATLNNRI
jgi:hypothetical protein